jgi:competence protein ComEC
LIIPCHNSIQMRRWVKKQIHVSWFIAWASLGFIAGVALSVFPWSRPFVDYSWVVFGVALFASALIKRQFAFVTLALIAGLFFGLWRGAIEKQALNFYQPYYGKNLIITGKISEDTSFGPQGDQRFRLGDVKTGGQSLPEEIWVSTTSALKIKRGDIVTIKGHLEKGFGNMPASIYRASIVNLTRPYPGDIGIRIRDKFDQGAKNAIPEPELSLGLGYLVGQKSTLPETLDQQIKTVGLTHAIVASGYNLTILVAFACRIFAKKSKYLAALSGGIMISGFILITGFSPSMSRAGLVSGLSLLAWYYGRKIHPLVLLPFAAAITVLIQPSYVWGDIGWYLSFSAFIGVIVLAPLLNHYFWGADKKPHALRSLVVDTVAAQIATMPIILLSFHQYSKYALLANVLVLPLVPLAMLFTFIAGILGLLVPSIAGIAGLPALSLLSYSTHIISFIANLPNAKTEIDFSSKLLIVSYLMLFLLILFLWRKTQHSFRKETAHE